MKFKFKIQEYHTDVENAVIKAFEWQRFNGRMVSLYAVFSGSSMANDSVGTNSEQIFASYSSNITRKVL